MNEREKATDEDEVQEASTETGADPASVPQPGESDDAEGGSRLIRGLGEWTRADLDAFAGYLARLNAGASSDAARGPLGCGPDADAAAEAPSAPVHAA